MNNSSDAAAAGFAAFGFGMLFMYAVVGIAVLIAYYKIVEKSGYPGWYVFGLLVPCLNLVLLFMFAFKPWPIEEEVARLRGMGGGGVPPGDPGNYYRPPGA